MEYWIWILRVLWTLFCLCAIFPNCLILFLIHFRTPKEYGSYSILLLNYALTELISSIANWATMERCIPSVHGLSFVAYGPCSLLSNSMCFIFHTILMHTYCNLVFVQPLSFAYRLYVLSYNPPTKLQITVFSAVLYIPSLLVIIFLNQISADRSHILPFLTDAKYSNIVHSDLPIYGLKDIKSWQNIYVLGILFCTVPSYIAVLTLRYVVLKKIDHLTHKMSEKTKKMHKMLVRALWLQAMVPLIMIVAVATFAVGQLGLVNDPILETVTFLIASIIPVLSPLTTLFCVPFYRKIINSWFQSGAPTTITFFRKQSVHSNLATPTVTNTVL